MFNWTTVADLATAGGTLVLVVATFSSVRSGNRTARAAERSLLVGLRPLLMPSRFEDPPEKVEGHLRTGQQHRFLAGGSTRSGDA